MAYSHIKIKNILDFFNHADKAVKNFPQLYELLAVIKKELKKEFAKGRIVWENRYDY